MATILIYLVITVSGSSTATVRFDSDHACVAAATKMQNRTFRDENASHRVEVLGCFPAK